MNIGDTVKLHNYASHPMYNFVITSLKSKVGQEYVVARKMEGNKIISNETHISIKSIA